MKDHWMSLFLYWVAQRLNEPSTWRGVVWGLTALGLTLTPEHIEKVMTFGMALAGLIGVFLPDERP